jgi:hypothetical protein
MTGALFVARAGWSPATGIGLLEKNQIAIRASIRDKGTEYRRLGW